MAQPLPPDLALAKALSPSCLHVIYPHPQPLCIIPCCRFTWHTGNRATDARFQFLAPTPLRFGLVNAQPHCPHVIHPRPPQHHSALPFHTARPKSSTPARFRVFKPFNYFRCGCHSILPYSSHYLLGPFLSSGNLIILPCCLSKPSAASPTSLHSHRSKLVLRNDHAHFIHRFSSSNAWASRSLHKTLSIDPLFN